MKKKFSKILIFLTGITLLTILMTFSASAKEVKSGYFTFNVGSKSASLTRYTGKEKSVTIPSSISGVSVTSISGQAFADCGTITSLTIPSKVTSIGDYAFSCCKSLTTIKLPSSLKTIGTAAFDSCISLTKVVLPSKVTTVKSSAFWYCTGLTKIVIPASVTKIGDKAFTGCKKLTAYVIPKTYGENYVKSASNINLAYRYIQSVKLNSSALSLAVGTTSALKYTVSPSAVYYKAVTYSTGNKKVATVSSTGVITAVSCGTTKITCTAADGSKKSVSCTITVVPAKIGKVYQSSTTTTSFNIKWTAVTGVTGYRIYSYNTSTKKWVALGNTTKTYYKVTGLPLGSSISYRVRAYTTIAKKNYYGAVSSTYTAKTLVPDSVSTVKATSTASIVFLSWEKAKNATNYYVYKYDFATKKATRLGLTASTRYNVANDLTANTQYGFFVRAVIKEETKYLFCEKNSAVTYINTLPAIITTLSVDEESVFFDRATVKWEPSLNVNGYIISIFNENGELLRDYKAEGQDKNSAEILDLSSGTKYIFKIRAYTINKSVTYFSDYSAPVAVTTNDKPATKTEAFGKFVEAYNNTKNSTATFSFFNSVYFDNHNEISADETEQKLFDVLATPTDNRQFNIVQGADKDSKKPLTSILAPEGLSTTLSIDDIVADSLVYTETNGSGYSVKFTLKGDQNSSAFHDKILMPTDFDAFTSEVENSKIDSYSYSGITIDAKIRIVKTDSDSEKTSLLLESLNISCPVELNYSVNSESGSIKDVINYGYYFLFPYFQ